ncbi:MAG: TerD family protein [Candidatus Nitrosotenuis sp.]
MAINLEKLTTGSSINLSKKDDTLTKVRATLYWKAPNYFPAFDLDVSAFVCRNTPNGPKLLTDEWFVFYNNEASPNGAVVKSPDEKESGSETLDIEIPALPAEAEEISIIVTIHKADERAQNFGQIEEAGIEISNAVTGDKICFYDLDAEFKNETAVQVGSFFKDANGFSFQAVGAGYTLGLGDFVAGYQ